jgi:hypothetical protein
VDIAARPVYILDNFLPWEERNGMVAKSKAKTGKKKSNKGRLKTLNLKRESVKDVTAREQKKIKGGGGLAGSVIAGGSRESG